MKGLVQSFPNAITREEVVKGAMYLDECYLSKDGHLEGYDPHQAFADKIGCSRQRAKELSYILCYIPEHM